MLSTTMLYWKKLKCPVPKIAQAFGIWKYEEFKRPVPVCSEISAWNRERMNYQYQE